MAKKSHHVYVEITDKTHVYTFRTSGKMTGYGAHTGWYLSSSRVCKSCKEKVVIDYMGFTLKQKIQSWPKGWNKDVQTKLIKKLVAELKERGYFQPKAKKAKPAPKKAAPKKAAKKRHVEAPVSDEQLNEPASDPPSGSALPPLMDAGVGAVGMPEPEKPGTLGDGTICEEAEAIEHDTSPIPPDRTPEDCARTGGA